MGNHNLKSARENLIETIGSTYGDATSPLHEDIAMGDLLSRASETINRLSKQVKAAHVQSELQNSVISELQSEIKVLRIADGRSKMNEMYQRLQNILGLSTLSHFHILDKAAIELLDLYNTLETLRSRNHTLKDKLEARGAPPSLSSDLVDSYQAMDESLKAIAMALEANGWPIKDGDIVETLIQRLANSPAYDINTWCDVFLTVRDTDTYERACEQADRLGRDA